MKSGRIAVLVVIVVGLGVQRVTAQPAAADKLRVQAEALYGQSNQLRRAAQLHEREAAQRSPADPRLVEALDRAARLYSYTGDHLRGRELMRQAAQHALECGDVWRAANAYLDAAFMALYGRNKEASDGLVARANRLALSPLLSESQKVAIARRIDPRRSEVGLK